MLKYPKNLVKHQRSQKNSVFGVFVSVAAAIFPMLAPNQVRSQENDGLATLLFAYSVPFTTVEYRFRRLDLASGRFVGEPLIISTRSSSELEGTIRKETSDRIKELHALPGQYVLTFATYSDSDGRFYNSYNFCPALFSTANTIELGVANWLVSTNVLPPSYPGRYLQPPTAEKLGEFWMGIQRGRTGLPTSSRIDTPSFAVSWKPLGYRTAELCEGNSEFVIIRKLGL